MDEELETNKMVLEYYLKAQKERKIKLDVKSFWIGFNEGLKHSLKILKEPE